MGIEPTTPCLQSAQPAGAGPGPMGDCPGRRLCGRGGECPAMRVVALCYALVARASSGVDQDPAAIEDRGDLDFAAELADDRAEGLE